MPFERTQNKMPLDGRCKEFGETYPKVLKDEQTEKNSSHSTLSIRSECIWPAEMHYGAHRQFYVATQSGRSPCVLIAFVANRQSSKPLATIRGRHVVKDNRPDK